MNKNYLKKLYKYDDVKNRYMIEVSLDDYLELFNAWDAAPIKKKELDPELLVYLEDVAEDIPMRDDIEVVFVMPEAEKNLEMEEISKQVFRNYFNYLINLNRRTMSRSWKLSIYYFITSFIFVGLAYLLQFKTTLFIEILSEGLFIGGWVFMWEAISILVFKTSSVRRQSKRYLRYAESDISYEYR